MYGKGTSKESNCQKWLFTNVNTDSINKQFNTIKTMTLKRRIVSKPEGVSKALRSCHWTQIYSKNGNNNHKE